MFGLIVTGEHCEYYIKAYLTSAINERGAHVGVTQPATMARTIFMALAP